MIQITASSLSSLLVTRKAEESFAEAAESSSSSFSLICNQYHVHTYTVGFAEDWGA